VAPEDRTCRLVSKIGGMGEMSTVQELPPHRVHRIFEDIGRFCEMPISCVKHFQSEKKKTGIAAYSTDSRWIAWVEIGLVISSVILDKLVRVIYLANKKFSARLQGQGKNVCVKYMGEAS
jgi:hypothetical protein